MANTSLSKKLTGAAGLVLVIGIAVAVNVIASRFGGLRADLTEENLYSLSSGTKTVLKDLKRDVTIKFFWTQDNEDVPPMLQQYGQRVLDLLKEYEVAGNGRVFLEVINPEPDTEEEEWARKFGVQPRPVDPTGAVEFYCGVVARSGDVDKALGVLDEREDEQIEYKLTRLITEVTTVTKPKVGLISSLPVMGSGPMGNPFMQRQAQQPKWFFVQQLETQMQVQDLGASADSIPADIKTLVLVQPKALAEKTQYAIDQFLLRGGRVLAFLDPNCMADPQGGPMPGMGGGPADLGKLLPAWGVEFNGELIAADKALSTRLQTQRRVQDFPTFLSLTKAQVDQGDIATAGLESIFLPTAGFFKAGPAKSGLTRTDLVKTTDTGATLNSFMAMGDDAEAMAKNMQSAGALPLVVKLSGKFPSAFPDGAPKPAEGEAPAATPATPHLKEAQTEGVVVLVADADMLSDRWSVQIQNFLGTMMVQQLNDNLNLVLNLTEYLGGNNALLTLRSRGTYARPFTTIQKMEADAKQRFETEIGKLQSQYDEARRKLQELQAGKAKDQKMILSPEQKAEIAKLEEQEIAASKRIREIRKELRREIEGTEKRIQFLNIIGVPVLVGLAGLIVGSVRRSRANSK